MFEHFLSHAKCIFNELLVITNPFDSITIAYYGFSFCKSFCKASAKNIKSQSASGWNRLEPVLSSGQVGCLCSSILQVSISDNDLPSTPSEEVISQTQSFSIFYVSQYCMTHAIWRICDMTHIIWETGLNRTENPPTWTHHFMSDIITSRLAFRSMFQCFRTAFWLVDNIRIFTVFLFEISRIFSLTIFFGKSWFLSHSRKLSSTTICLWTAEAVNSPTMFALTIPKLVR